VVGAVIVLVVVVGLVSTVSLAVVRHGTRLASRRAPPAPDPASPPSLPRTRIPWRSTDPRSHASARPRKPSRPAIRRDPSSTGRRRGWGPLTALSAVEKRGRLARLDTVTFVEGTPATPTATPALADAAAAPAPRADHAVVVPEPAVAFEAAPVPSARKLQAPCQIVRVEQVGPGTMIDLITLRPCDVAGQAVPSGTPLALGFGPVPPGAACQDLEAVMGYWEAIGAVVDLEVVESPQATRYRFDCREDGLALLVQSERP
jgi:hypothetical protein